MAENFQAAARRSSKDADLLYENSRLGTADHLYGLAAECALKAILERCGVLSPSNIPTQLKCHIDKLWTEYGIHASGRKMPPIPNDNPFSSWRVHDRYEADHKFTQERVAGHRRGALQVLSFMVQFFEESL